MLPLYWLPLLPLSISLPFFKKPPPSPHTRAFALFVVLFLFVVEQHSVVIGERRTHTHTHHPVAFFLCFEDHMLLLLLLLQSKPLLTKPLYVADGDHHNETHKRY
jgi:hypothetical protein